MLTTIEECDGERMLTLRIDEASIDAELVRVIESVLDDFAQHGVENLVFRFTGDRDCVAGEFPSWQPGPARSDMRYFARWDETLARICRLRAKTLTAYDGRVGAAAVQVGGAQAFALPRPGGAALEHGAARLLVQVGLDHAPGDKVSFDGHEPPASSM